MELSRAGDPVAPPSVLAIDDAPDNLELLKIGLEKRGFRVRTALGGEAGLRALGEEPPDLVLLDVAMPDIDGFAVLARLRAAPETADVPVIMLTAAGQDAIMVERGLTGGADEYLVKPVGLAELAVRMQHVLARQARLTRRPRADLAELATRLGEVRVAFQDARAAAPMPMAQWERFNHALGMLEGLDREVGRRLGEARVTIAGREAGRPEAPRL